MRAAIYIRSVQGDAPPPVTQESLCRAYIAHRGWTLDDAAVFRELSVTEDVDDHRPVLAKLQQAVRDKRFDVLLMSRPNAQVRHAVIGLMFIEGKAGSGRLSDPIEIEAPSPTSDSMRPMEELLRAWFDDLDARTRSS